MSEAEFERRVASALSTPMPAGAHARAAIMDRVVKLDVARQLEEEASVSPFVASLRLDPNQAEPHFQLAKIFERQGKFELAIKQYQATLAIDQAFPGAANI